MLGPIQTGKLGFGIWPQPMHAKLVQRVGTSLLAGELLMLDLENSAYDLGATQTGVFGNGITPAAAGTGGAATLGVHWPMALAVNGTGTASGTIIDVLVAGIGTVRCQNTSGLAAIKGLAYEVVVGSRNPNVRNVAFTQATRPLGFLLTTHTSGTGVEAVTASFNGIKTR